MKQESLLPSTDAIMKNTLEWTPYRGKHLVRYKDAAGNVHRCLTPSYERALSEFEKFKAMMREEAR